ncbi:chalcone isomerase family protein [Photobacterium sp. TLY01]|uniref:chalcone isomerase family protein n=1 Tax=Photobacterium sp. TLY01 TaxID=2907534 RepID=UPI001F294574|nr:chalcone isomerase family protein [Photobacterium sp. TLY01]UIP29897.1 chalcone isomerase family protein [Photobacterium sp. TLY01]
MRLLAIFTLLLLAVSPGLLASGAWQSWPVVGEATLKWGPWVIYDSQLRTPSGQYNATMANSVALVIKYQRDIDKEDLLEATDDQWQKQGVPTAKRQQWLMVLDTIWPSVRKGDRLIFVVHANGGTFFRDNTVIGEVRDREMADAFLGIWLSPGTQYPELRKRLIGRV